MHMKNNIPSEFFIGEMIQDLEFQSKKVQA